MQRNAKMSQCVHGWQRRKVLHTLLGHQSFAKWLSKHVLRICWPRLYTFLWKVPLTFPSFSLGSLLVYIGLYWFVLGSHGRGTLGRPKDPMGGDPREPKGSMGGDPGSPRDPWEGTLGSPRDPMGGDPGEPKGSHGRGPLGAQGIPWEGTQGIPWEGTLGASLGANLKEFCDEVTFKK